jgi:hypothetical protein
MGCFRELFTREPCCARADYMTGPFSQYMAAIEKDLRAEYRRLLHGNLYLTILDWYTAGVAPEEASVRIKNALEG